MIPKTRQDDALYLIWVLTTTLESKCSEGDILDKLQVESGFRFLREMRYTNLHTRWERNDT